MTVIGLDVGHSNLKIAIGALTLIRFDPPCAKKIDPSHDLS